VNTPIDERTLRTAAALGIDADSAPSHAALAAALAHAAVRIHALTAPGQTALIAGRSGAGKSTLLRLLARRPHTEAVRPLRRGQARARVAALNRRMPLALWSRLLARFGLAEGRVLVCRAGDLSAGERARLELALAAARCETAGARTLLVDEWCSVLDRPTAAAVAIGAARWARERRVRLIGATAHDDLAAAMLPDVTVRLEGQDGQGGVRWTVCEWSRAG